MILLAGIYIHIPFCKQACHYCDFHFSTSRSLLQPLLDAIVIEMDLRSKYLSDHTITTIYFGGGTPSLLNARQIQLILERISRHFLVTEQVEITLETNPDDLSENFLESINQAGVNRLSIGIQSFQQPVLEWMNRAHNRDQALGCLERSVKAGFKNISIDLIYAIPLKSYHFGSDLDIAIKFKPDHISAYNLTIEPGTFFGHQLKKGRLSEVDEEQAAQDFTSAMDRLRNAGYHHYEISNFCLPGKQSRHNLGYWNGTPYLGLGPSAHSFDGESRQYNISSNGGYIQALEKRLVPATVENLSPAQRINEMILLGLRTTKGVPLQLRWGNLTRNLEIQDHDYIDRLVNGALAVVQQNRLILTDQGKLLADRIAEDLFMDEVVNGQ